MAKPRWGKNGFYMAGRPTREQADTKVILGLVAAVAAILLMFVAVGIKLVIDALR